MGNAIGQVGPSNAVRTDRHPKAPLLVNHLVASARPRFLLIPDHIGSADPLDLSRIHHEAIFLRPVQIAYSNQVVGTAASPYHMAQIGPTPAYPVETLCIANRARPNSALGSGRV